MQQNEKVAIVTCAGSGISTPAATIDETPVETWRAVVDTNLTGSFLCARAGFAQMRRQSPQGCRIINDGSIAAQVPSACHEALERF